MSAVAVILCGHCAAERRSQPGRVGEVIRHNGRLLWHGFDPPSARALRNFRGGDPPVARHYWATLVDPFDPALEVPDKLPTWCSRHGPDQVAATEVVARAHGSMPPATR